MSSIKVGDFVFTNKAMNPDERGLAGFVHAFTSEEGIRVNTNKGALIFQTASVTRVRVGDVVVVLSPLHPDWNGEAAVSGILSQGAMIEVVPLSGPRRGIRGAFRPDEISTVTPAPVTPEPEAPAEDVDFIREFAASLEVHANLISEAAAYALALADTLDQIKENALV